MRCIAKVADVHKLDQKTKRTFRKHAAQPYDDRILRFTANETISLWRLSGREKIGFWYLAAVCNFDDPKLLTPDGVLGVDFGIINIATDSLGNQHCGSKVEVYRERYAKRRATLQRVGTRAVKHRLRQIGGRQKRFQKYENHCISKRIVSTAETSLATSLTGLS